MLDWILRPIAEQISALREEVAGWLLTDIDRRKRGVVVIEFDRNTVEGSQEWSKPALIRFQRLPNGEWMLDVRDVGQRLYEQKIAERAQRQ